MNRITSFDGEHAFLSNSHPAAVTFEGVTYPTVEHAFHAAKTREDAQRLAMLDLPPRQATRKGHGLEPRPDWNAVRVPLMHALVYEKFSTHPNLGKALLSTGDDELVNGNRRGDTFWGVCRGIGENHLGRILMHVRAQLREEAARHG